jgi:hypothetical protein
LSKAAELEGVTAALKTVFCLVTAWFRGKQNSGGNLQRLFTTFPGGLPGLGLLLLRLTVAGTVLFLTFVPFFDLVSSTFRGWLIGAVSIVFSATMISGLLTPVIGSLVFIGGILFLLLAQRETNSAVVIYLIALSFVIILLGPGAYSLDAWLFGRREIKL